MSKSLRLAFLSHGSAMGFHQIGGVESLVRRLVMHAVENGHVVDYVSYGREAERKQEIGTSIHASEFVGMADALDHLAASADRVAVGYVPVRDRMRLGRFRRRHRDAVFYKIVVSPPDSIVKGNLRLLDAMVWPFNGGALCVSPRLVRMAKRRGIAAELLLPPVPESFFLRPEEKRDSEPIRVTFLGRVDPGKGIEDVMEIFDRLSGCDRVETQICAYHHPGSSESTEIHERLLSRKNIRYVPVDYQRWTPEVEQHVAEVLAETDVLLLPYRRLRSTIDLPVLLLEGMASLCAVLTKPLGDIPAVYGDSPFLLRERDFVSAAVERILSARDLLGAERDRLVRQNRKWRFDAETVGRRFLALLSQTTDADRAVVA